MRGSVMSLTAAARGFVVSLLSMSVVLGQSEWEVTYSATEICAPTGSTVNIRCTYRFPIIRNGQTTIGETFWFTKESNRVPIGLTTDPDYINRVEYYVENDHVLRIRDVRKSDSAVYKFMLITNNGNITGLPGVRLYVSDLQVQVINSKRSLDLSTADMKCQSLCPGHTDYVWFKDKHVIRNPSSSLVVSVDPTSKYYCAVTGYNMFPSPPVYAPVVSSVSVSPSSEVVEGRSVTLTCSSDANPAATYTWYKRQQPQLQFLIKGQQLVFSPIQSTDSGEYYCVAHNALGRKWSGYKFLDVQYAPVVSSVSVSPSGEVVEGRSVTLTCSSDANPAATYTWYKRQQPQLQFLIKGQQLVFSRIQSADSGEYYCVAHNALGRKWSGYKFLDVQYAPVVPSVSVSPSGEVVEGRSVTLTCSSDANPAATYTWYRKKETPQDINISSGQQLVFSPIQSADSGEYYCGAHNGLGRKWSEYKFLDVQYAPKLPSVSVSPSGEIMEGRSVNLTCSSDANPAATYTWYKENEDSPLSSKQTLNIPETRTEHSGNYYCEAINIRGRQNSTLHLTVVTGIGKFIAAAVITVVLLTVTLLLGFCWFRKKRAFEESSEPAEGPANVNQNQPDHEQPEDELSYATIHFHNNHSDPLHSNTRAARPHGLIKDMDVTEYSPIRFKSSAQRNKTQDVEDDPSVLYSKVAKTKRPD